jgi:pyruvate/2-oxoglutarate/acetoin dehydrogenase E1 component
VIFIEHGSLYSLKGPVPEEDYFIPIGLADIKKEGKDISIITYSLMVQKALSAANRLKEDGIDVEVVDLRTLKPLDVETITKSVRKTHKVVVAHEACLTGGFGGEIIARIVENAFDYLDAPIKRVGVPDVPIPYAKSLEDVVVPKEEFLIKSVREVLRDL